MKMKRKFLTEIPRVLLVVSTAAKSNRDKLAGIYHYIKLHTPWNVQLVDRFNEPQTIDNIREWKVHGMIIGRIPDARENVTDLAIPTVIMDAKMGRYTADFKKASFITCDSKAIAHAGVDYLVSQGFKNFASIGESQGNEWYVKRCRSFREHLHALGFSCNNYACAVPGAMNTKDWIQDQDKLVRWLKALPKQTAVFAPNDHQAHQVLEICQFACINVPVDLAVLGVDNDELLCEGTTPTLSSIQPDFEACGYQAAQLLDQLMSCTTGAPVHIFYGAKRTVERESTQFRSVELDARVRTGLNFIRLNATRAIGVSDITRHMHVSRRMAELLFRRNLDHSIGQEIQLARVEKLKRLLADTTRPITMLCGLCGYQNESHAKLMFKRIVGKTMSAFRKEQRANSHTGSEGLSNLRKNIHQWH